MALKRRHVKAIIQFRRGLESEWIALDPILNVGEPALSTDVYKIKIGDGFHQWHELDYLTDEEIQALTNRIDNLTFSDLTHGETMVINCGTSTTNVGGGE